MSFSVVDEAIVENVQIASSIVASVLGLLIHGYILYRFFYHRSSLTNYQNLIVVQSIIASICIVVLLVANQRATLYGRVILFFPFMPFDATAGLYFSGFIAAAQTFEEFLVIIFNIHRVLIFMRPNWLRKFYWFFTPVVFGYSILIGVLVIQLRQTPLVASLLPSVLVVVITITSIVCYLLISRHFRSNAGYTRNVRQMQTRFSFSILIQGVIHCFMGICIMLIVPIDLFLKFIIGKHEDAMQIVSLCYSLIILTLLRWYSVVTGLLTLWSIRGFLFRKKHAAASIKKGTNSTSLQQQQQHHQQAGRFSLVRVGG